MARKIFFSWETKISRQLVGLLCSQVIYTILISLYLSVYISGTIGIYSHPLAPPTTHCYHDNAFVTGRGIGELLGRNSRAYALIGAAGILGGITRMTLSVTVMMVEASGWVLVSASVSRSFLESRID